MIFRPPYEKRPKTFHKYFLKKKIIKDVKKAFFWAIWAFLNPKLSYNFSSKKYFSLEVLILGFLAHCAGGEGGEGGYDKCLGELIPEVNKAWKIVMVALQTDQEAKPNMKQGGNYLTSPYFLSQPVGQ